MAKKMTEVSEDYNDILLVAPPTNFYSRDPEVVELRLMYEYWHHLREPLTTTQCPKTTITAAHMAHHKPQHNFNSSSGHLTLSRSTNSFKIGCYKKFNLATKMSKNYKYTVKESTNTIKDL